MLGDAPEVLRARVPGVAERGRGRARARAVQQIGAAQERLHGIGRDRGREWIAQTETNEASARGGAREQSESGVRAVRIFRIRQRVRGVRGGGERGAEERAARTFAPRVRAGILVRRATAPAREPRRASRLRNAGACRPRRANRRPRARSRRAPFRLPESKAPRPPTPRAPASTTVSPPPERVLERAANPRKASPEPRPGPRSSRAIRLPPRDAHPPNSLGGSDGRPTPEARALRCLQANAGRPENLQHYCLLSALKRRIWPARPDRVGGQDFGICFHRGIVNRAFRSRSLVVERWTSRTALRDARGGDVCVVLDAPAAPARVADPDPFARARAASDSRASASPGRPGRERVVASAAETTGSTRAMAGCAPPRLAVALGVRLRAGQGASRRSGGALDRGGAPAAVRARGRARRADRAAHQPDVRPRVRRRGGARAPRAFRGVLPRRPLRWRRRRRRARRPAGPPRPVPRRAVQPRAVARGRAHDGRGGQGDVRARRRARRVRRVHVLPRAASARRRDQGSVRRVSEKRAC